MNHKAIYALYPQVVTVDDGTGAFDKDGKSDWMHEEVEEEEDDI